MTGRERNELHVLVDQEVRARKEARVVMREVVPRRRKRGAVVHCIYCGQRTYGRVCPQHRDLVQIDPGMGAVA